jgi:D-amino-acid dehydrogenase
MKHILVIGAGITGVTTAYSLLDRGFAVTVLDRQSYPAMETSFANGGQLSASNAEVWNSWPTVLRGLRYMMKGDAPLLLNPKPSWQKYSWLAEFVWNIRNHRKNTVETVRLAIQAREHLFAMAEREGIDFDLQRRGILHVYRDRASFEIAKITNAMLLEGGLERYAVTPDEMRSIEPALTGDFHAGFFTPSDSTGDIHKFTRGLAAACARRGAQFVQDAEVLDIVPGEAGVRVDWRRSGARGPRQAIAADAIVICAGVGSRRLGAMVGDRIAIYPVKGYSITIGLDDETSQKGAPWVSLLDEQAKIVTSRLGVDRFRVAGTAEFAGIDFDIRHDRIRPLVAWSRRMFPQVSTARVVPWAGLRPMTPDMMPRVGPGKRRGIFYNTGHGHLGWTLSAATAQIVAETVSASLEPAAGIGIGGVTAAGRSKPPQPTYS